MKHPSRDQLIKSMDRRVKHLMIRVLEKFEDRFPDLDETREGQIFKGDLRNAFNDVIRAQRDEIRDYEVDYRPLKLTDDNILAMTQTFMSAVQKVEFSFTDNGQPYIMFYADESNIKVLDALRAELEAGVVTRSDNDAVFSIVGVKACIDSVLPCMDKYRLHAKVHAEYVVWRQEVVRMYFHEQ